jgi:hypothetical protein
VPLVNRSDVERLWLRYANHAELVFRDGPRPTSEVSERWFVAASGADHVDLNQAALFGAASESDAQDLAARVLAAGAPFLLSCSDGVVDRVARTLAAADFQRLPNREALFHRAGPPPAPAPSPFDVRRVRTAADIVAMSAVFEEAHGYDPALIYRLYGERVGIEDGFSAWLAWEGDEPVSFTIVTECMASLALWDVMTPIRHRRRGAGRAVVSSALAAAAAAAHSTIEETIFWSTPLGRPLYESMGFSIADDIDAWTLGASPEDLAAVGA